MNFASMSKAADRSVNILVVISSVLEHCALHVSLLLDTSFK